MFRKEIHSLTRNDSVLYGIDLFFKFGETMNCLTMAGFVAKFNSEISLQLGDVFLFLIKNIY